MILAHQPEADTHLPPRPYGDRWSRVHWIPAVKPEARAVVFVHGFGSDALDAWTAFDELLPLESAAAGYDLYFYGYDALNGELHASIARCRQFFEHLLEIRHPKTLVIVAHSLGAVVSRWALIDLAVAKRFESVSLRFVLFAPAHSGAEVTALALGAFSGFKVLPLFAGLVRYRLPLVRQLEQGSRELLALRAVAAALADTGDTTAVPRIVALAELERVVNNERFPGDPLPRTIEGTDHSSVCKPTDSLPDPLNTVLEVL